MDLKKINTLLLVEDDDRDYLAIKETLKFFPYEIIRFSIAEDALVYLDDHEVDIIVSDQNLPGIKGLDFFKRLKTQGFLTPTMLLTGAGNELLAAESIRLGVDEYVIKDVGAGYLELLSFLLVRACERKQDNLEKKLIQHKKTLNALVMETMLEGVIITNAKNEIIETNEAFTKITGYTLEDVIGKNPSILSSDKHDPLFFEYMWDDINIKGHWTGKIFNRRKNGEIYPEWLTISCIKDADESVINYLAIFSDIEGKQSNFHGLLSHYAYYDGLTGLPNRLLLDERLSYGINRAQRQCNRMVFMALDLDRFKLVNDTYGHAVGDELLVEVAERLSACTRSTDIVGRISGDEFVVLLPEITKIHEIESVAEKIINALSEVYNLQGNSISISVSIGIAIYPDDTKDNNELRKLADIALYHSKSLGRNCFQYFTEEMNDQNHEREKVKSDLNKAISEKQFELYFQPIINIQTGSIKAVEALVRWQHPERGMLLPHCFLDIATESHLMQYIGFWVFTEVIELLSKKSSGHFNRITVNLSVNELLNTTLIDHIAQLLKDKKIATGRLIIEVSEQVLQHDEKTSLQRNLFSLHVAGCELWADNFLQVPLDLAQFISYGFNAVKIDVKDLISSEDYELLSKLCDAVLKMMEGLSIPVIYKNIESNEQCEMIKTLDRGCWQGNNFSVPLSLTQVKQLEGQQ